MLDMIDTTQMVGTVSLVGNSYSLTKTVAGKVFLAFGRQQAGTGFDVFSSSLREELGSIPKKGAGIDSECIGAGVTCLAVPLFDAQGKVPGSLCMVGPLSQDHQDRVRPKVALSLEESRTQIADYIRYYNEERLHSSIGYVAPKDKLDGHDKQIFTERDQKLEAAREFRKQKRLEEKRRPIHHQKILCHS